jgi:UDP:flavonoid glycosyltransferase YjiC (YdhE family)
MPRLSVVVSLGNSPSGESVRAELQGKNVQVQTYVDQWGVLTESDVFITHNGLNSTHEAIVSCVPMISYPFFADQPHMARTCEELGIAFPLAAELREPLTVEMVRSALQRYMDERDEMLVNLAVVRQWELDAIAGPGQVVAQILALADPPTEWTLPASR